MQQEISIIPFKFKNFNDLRELHHLQKYPQISEIKMKTLPKIGYIAYLGDSPIAAGFLRRVEGGFAQLDTFVSNPHFGSQVRHIGIEGVKSALLEEAKVLKLEGIIVLTDDGSIISRAVDTGFNVLEAHRILVKRL